MKTIPACATLSQLICAAALATLTVSATAASAPIPVTEADGEAHQPFQHDIGYFQGDGSGGFDRMGTFTVPAGKELVIQSFSALAYTPGSNRVVLEIQTVSGGVTVLHYAGVLVPGPTNNYTMLPLVSGRLHADPGTVVSVSVLRDNPPGTNVGYYTDVTISGYLVNVP